MKRQRWRKIKYKKHERISQGCPNMKKPKNGTRKRRRNKKQKTILSQFMGESVELHYAVWLPLATKAN